MNETIKDIMFILVLLLIIYIITKLLPYCMKYFYWVQIQIIEIQQMNQSHKNADMTKKNRHGNEKNE